MMTDLVPLTTMQCDSAWSGTPFTNVIFIGVGYTSNIIIKSVMYFTLALSFQGHDTTAAGSSFFLSMMGVHQHIQDKVIEELDQIFGDSDRPATFQDTLEMKYLERCLMETLRLYPPVPIIARQINQDVTLREYLFNT